MNQKGIAPLIIILGVFVVVSIIVGYLYIFKMQSLNISEFTQIYSNGWYGYSFKYPQNAGLRTVLGSSNGIDVRLSQTGVGGSSCSVEVSPRDSQFTKRIDDPQKVITFNNISWKKERYVSLPNDILYRYAGARWQTIKDKLAYTFDSTQDNEQVCEAIISTFNFSTDSSVQSALEAKNAKDVGILYAQTKYPNMFFLEGNFVNNFENQSTPEGIQDFTTNALIYFANSGNATLQEQVKLKMEKMDSKWVVLGESRD